MVSQYQTCRPKPRIRPLMSGTPDRARLEIMHIRGLENPNSDIAKPPPISYMIMNHLQNLGLAIQIGPRQRIFKTSGEAHEVMNFAPIAQKGTYPNWYCSVYFGLQYRVATADVYL